LERGVAIEPLLAVLLSRLVQLGEAPLHAVDADALARWTIQQLHGAIPAIADLDSALMCLLDDVDEVQPLAWCPISAVEDLEPSRCQAIEMGNLAAFSQWTAELIANLDGSALLMRLLVWRADGRSCREFARQHGLGLRYLRFLLEDCRQRLLRSRGSESSCYSA
jgi:hypothetical protein